MKSGVYIIYNLVTGGFYIGSSVTVSKRISTHKRHLLTKKHHCARLQNSYNKHGKESFIYSILKYTPIDECLFWENFYFNLLSPSYNISKVAGSPMKGRKHSKETIKKLRKRKVKKGKDHYLYGKSMPISTKAKMSEKRKAHRWSEKVKKKMSDTAKRLNSINRVNRELQMIPIKDNVGNVFKSLSEASKFHNIPVSTICDNLKGRSKLVRKKYTFSYIENFTHSTGHG